jgi:hypothetical protein
MTVVLRSLSDFKRFLSEPGATIQVVRNTFIDRQPASYQEAYRAKGLYAPRTIRAVSKKAAIFAVEGHPTTIWLYWDKGTRKWRFHEDTVAIPLDTGLGPPDEIVYRCGYTPGMESAGRPARSTKARAPKPPDTLKPPPPKAPPAIKSPSPAAAPKPTLRPVMPARGQGRLL